MPPRLSSALELVDLAPEEAEDFFANEVPERVVALVDDLDDAQVAQLVEVQHVRETAVRVILTRLGEFALPAGTDVTTNAVQVRRSLDGVILAGSVYESGRALRSTVTPFANNCRL